MSVLIKGMELPKDCFECVMSDAGGNCLLQDRNFLPWNEQIKCCPLVEIPEPHGRLIDADAYCKDLLEEAHRVWGLLKPETIERINRTVDDLKNYPAVVEAEGSENHDD